MTIDAASSRQPLVGLTDISFAYSRGLPVLSGVSASFSPGAVHAVSGPSGCGKSTLLTIAGLMLRPVTGRVVVAGEEMGRRSDADRADWRAHHIGFVFQDALLEPTMTVAESILEGLPIGRSHRAAAEHLDELVERLGLAGLATRRTSHLSGGQCQRVAVARAILKQPTVVLADEPTGNLDDATAEVVLRTLFDYGRQPGRTLIVVTHDVRIVERADTSLELTVCPR